MIHNVQIATDCNENIRKAENEFKLFAITRRFPNDDVEIVSVKTFRKKGEAIGMEKEMEKEIQLLIN